MALADFMVRVLIKGRIDPFHNINPYNMAIFWVTKGKVPYFYSRVIGYLTLLLRVLPIQMARPNEVEYRQTFKLISIKNKIKMN